MKKEIERIGESYRVAIEGSYQGLAKAYDNYVKLCILDEPREEQSKLLEMWEWEKE